MKLWISRHQPTEQMEDLLVTDIGLELGARNLTTSSDIDDYMEALANLVDSRFERIAGVAGVFPPAVLERFKRSMEAHHLQPVRILPVYAAWNINRAAEGEKPTFEFHSWCHIGEVAL